jgi:hypothetical protein
MLQLSASNLDLFLVVLNVRCRFLGQQKFCIVIVTYLIGSPPNKGIVLEMIPGMHSFLD